MGDGTSIPRWQAINLSSLLEANKLIDAGLYDQVADLLRSVQKPGNLFDDSGLSEILGAAYQICFTCEQIRAEKDQYHRACEDANRREQALQKNLFAIINLIVCGDLIQYGNTVHQTDTRFDAEISDPKWLSNIWQHFKKKLGLKNLQSVFIRGLPLELENKALLQDIAEDISVIETSVGKETITMDVIKGKGRDSSVPSLMVYCLGQFRVYQNDQLVKEWPSSKGKSIFKYLVSQRKYPAPKEVLMELFWPGTQPDAARNNLNVSIYGLRQALRSIKPNYSHILFQGESYLLNPEMDIWIDVEEFNERVQAGHSKKKQGEIELAVQDYRAAEVIYQGEFLVEDRYENWVIPLRRSLQDNYLKLLNCLGSYYLDQGDITTCISVCNKILIIDPCREDAHTRLMYCYCHEKQPYLALRQFHLCEESLKDELDISPSKEMLNLYRKIQDSGHM